MSDDPATPEGSLIRYYRECLSPRPSQASMAERLGGTAAGWSTEKYRNIECGYIRARRGHGPTTYAVIDADLVRIAVELIRIAEGIGTPPELRITPEELEKIGRAEAAERLRSALSPGAAPQQRQELTPEIIALARELFGLLIKDRTDREFLEFLARGTRGGEPKPLIELLNGLIGWVGDHPQRDGAGVREAG